MLLSLVLGLLAGGLAERQIKQDIGQELTSLAYYMANGLEQGMFERYREIQLLADLQIVRDPKTPTEERRILLEKLQSTLPSYSWIGFVNAQGVVQVSTNNLLEGESVAARSWFQAGRSHPYVGDVHEAQLLAKALPNPTGEPLRFVDIATPVQDSQNRLVGVLGAHLNWKWAEEVETILFNGPRTVGKDILVLTATGDIILESSPSPDDNLSSLESFASAKSSQKGFRIERWPDGKTYLTGFFQGTGYRSYPGLGWVVLVRQDISEAFAPAYRLRRQIIFGGVLLGGLFSALGWLLADQITRPILKIATAANQIRQGSPDVKIPVIIGNSETAKLSQALNQLITAVTTGEEELKTANQQLRSQLAISEQAAQELRRSEEQLRQIANNIDDALILKSGETGKAIYFNPGYTRLHNFTAETLQNDPAIWLTSVHPEDKSRIIRKFQSEIRLESFFDDEYRLINPDGTFRWIWDRSFPICDETGKIYRYVVIKRDVTDRKYAEEMFKTLAEVTAPLTGKELFLTLVLCLSKVLGVEHVLLAEQTSKEFRTLAYCAYGVLQPRCIYSLEDEPYHQLAEEGTLYYSEAVTRAFPSNQWLIDAHIQGFWGIALKTMSNQNLGHLCIFSESPLSERSRYETVLQVFSNRAAAELERQRIQEQLEYDATHDALTGLHNRRILIEQLELAVNRAKSDQDFQYAVLFVNLDRFKVINDSLGHIFGDQLLVQVAQCFRQLLQPKDFCIRLGGDEFVLLLTEFKESTAPTHMANCLFNALKRPFTLDGHTVRITATVGIAIGSSGYTQAEDLLRDANIAMHKARVKGKAQYEIFNAAMYEQASRKQVLEQALQQGLEREEFSLRYQPIIALSSRKLIGFEALVRWTHPTQGLISPAEFIPVAEETGLVVPLGQWVLETSCLQLANWQSQFSQALDLKISVNLSALQLREADLVQQIDQALSQSGLAGHNLTLEITESTLMEDVEEISALLTVLRDCGIQISIDDFGTGFSSLNYLHRLPANNLKIDRSFVSQMGESLRNQQIAETIITLADQLGMSAIAEGIETPAQLEQLQHFRCELGQGYLFDAPLTVAAATERIRESQGMR